MLLVWLFAIIFYMIRRVINFRDCMGCIPEGFKAMVPAIMILTFAWTLKAMTDSLGAAVFVEEAMRSVAGGIEVILPAIIFLVWMRTCICYRYFLGNLWYPDPDRCCGI